MKKGLWFGLSAAVALAALSGLNAAVARQDAAKKGRLDQLLSDVKQIIEKDKDLFKRFDALAKLEEAEKIAGPRAAEVKALRRLFEARLREVLGEAEKEGKEEEGDEDEELDEGDRLEEELELEFEKVEAMEVQLEALAEKVRSTEGADRGVLESRLKEEVKKFHELNQQVMQKELKLLAIRKAELEEELREIKENKEEILLEHFEELLNPEEEDEGDKGEDEGGEDETTR